MHMVHHFKFKPIKDYAKLLLLAKQYICMATNLEKKESRALGEGGCAPTHKTHLEVGGTREGNERKRGIYKDKLEVLNLHSHILNIVDSHLPLP